MRVLRSGLKWLACFLFASMVAPWAALSHSERPTEAPVRLGPVPEPSRTPTQVLDVCKTGGPNDGACGYEHIQAAVHAAADGALIRIWPGFYREEPSRAAPDLNPDQNGRYSYQHHVDHPNSQNLVAIVGKKNLTLRGMGACPRDVVVDAEFEKHVVIRGDRADGLIIQNLSVWHGYDHGVYVLDTDGFRLDRVHSGFSREYAFLTFANDYGLMESCEAFGSGDAGIYPGGTADTPGRFSMEVASCKSYDNVLGYSGSNGNHVWIHDSEFFNNAIGLTSDSLTDHPNYPQNRLVLERNLFYDNNQKVYGPAANIKPTVFTNSILIPKGVGVFLASGNENLVQNNQFWGHERYGVWLASGEGMVIGPTSEPPAPPFMSSDNQFIANRMFAPTTLPEGDSTVEGFQVSSDPNLNDFGWDGMGWGNCWEENTSSGAGDPASSDHPLLPPCHDPVLGTPMPATPPVPWAPNLLEQTGLVFVEDPTNGDKPTPLCKILGLEPCEYEEGENPMARNTPGGYVAPDAPTACGPESDECPSLCGS